MHEFEAAVEHIENMRQSFTVMDIVRSTAFSYTIVYRAVGFMASHGALRCVEPGRGPLPDVYEIAAYDPGDACRNCGGTHVTANPNGYYCTSCGWWKAKT